MESTLLATDLKRSVLQTLEANLQHPITYSPYGHRRAESGLSSLLGFNGERADPVTGHYLLGNGYRAFNPVLMRFNSPDSWSPFGKGGINSYQYCLGDPINRHDQNGHLSSSIFQKILDWKNRTIAWRATKTQAAEKYNKALAARPEDAQHKLYSIGNSFENHSPHKDRMNEHQSLRMPRDIQIREVSSLDDLRSLPDEQALESLSRTKYEITVGEKRILSFIFTPEKKLFVSSTRHQYLSDMTGHPYVISAGQIMKTGRENFTLTNGSGHFRPSFESLDPVKEFLEKLGANVRTLRIL
ncbi:RHS repeat-associated core domain-containing protein [Pseudomonas azerbaijanoccidentalis]